MIHTATMARMIEFFNPYLPTGFSFAIADSDLVGKWVAFRWAGVIWDGMQSNDVHTVYEFMAARVRWIRHQGVER